MDFLKAKKYNGQPVNFIQEKLDGHRAMICVDELRSMQVVTRVGTDIYPKLAAIPHIAKLLSNVPAMTIIDCEIYAPTRQATDVKTMINEQDAALQISAFALWRWKGNDLNKPTFLLSEEWFGWVGAEQLLQDMGLHTPLTIPLGVRPRVLDDDDLEELKQEAKDKGLEGWILKTAHLRGWYKLKTTKTVDAFIVGTSKSDSPTYYGQIKGIQCAVYNGKRQVVICSTGNGLSMEWKNQYSDKRNSLLNKVVTLEYDSVATQGRLKFPRVLTDSEGMVAFRDDKLPHECTIDQLEQ